MPVLLNHCDEPGEPHSGLVLALVVLSMILRFIFFSLCFYAYRVPTSCFLTCFPGVSYRRGWGQGLLLNQRGFLQY